MEYAYRYGDPGRLYLNVTNRCTNDCSFCIRRHASGLGGVALKGGPEPDLDALKDAVRRYGAPEGSEEFIWCGFGEPTYRLDLITGAAAWLRRSGAKIRLNTNGHACLIHGGDVLPDLAEAVDIVSVSLNAPSLKRYLSLCLPDPDSISAGPDRMPEDFWRATIDFLSRAPKYFREVRASVVGFALSAEEIKQAQTLAQSLGIERFRIR